MIDDPHLERVIAEKQELDDRLVRLEEYLRSGAAKATLSEAEVDLLDHQVFAMTRYSSVLRERIANWRSRAK